MIFFAKKKNYCIAFKIIFEISKEKKKVKWYTEKKRKRERTSFQHWERQLPHLCDINEIYWYHLVVIFSDWIWVDNNLIIEFIENCLSICESCSQKYNEKVYFAHSHCIVVAGWRCSRKQREKTFFVWMMKKS